jgi:hypothetical protein
MAERKTFWLRASALAGLLAVLGLWSWIEATPPPRVAPPAGQAMVIDRSPQAQSERKAVIDKLLADGLVRRIDPERGGALRVTLRPAFYTMDEETRRKYIDVIYRYYFDGASLNDTVILRDARNGNEVGHYNPYKDGLNMYK